MTVYELIQELVQYDPNYDVVFNIDADIGYECDCGNKSTINTNLDLCNANIKSNRYKTVIIKLD